MRLPRHANCCYLPTHLPHPPAPLRLPHSPACTAACRSPPCSRLRDARHRTCHARRAVGRLLPHGRRRGTCSPFVYACLFAHHHRLRAGTCLPRRLPLFTVVRRTTPLFRRASPLACLAARSGTSVHLLCRACHCLSATWVVRLCIAPARTASRRGDERGLHAACSAYRHEDGGVPATHLPTDASGQRLQTPWRLNRTWNERHSALDGGRGGDLVYFGAYRLLYLAFSCPDVGVYAQQAVDFDTNHPPHPPTPTGCYLHLPPRIRTRKF